MNTELRKLARNDFEKDLFKLMNNSVFGKTVENIRKHRDIKLVTTDKKRSKLVLEPNYHTINLISEDLSIIEMKKTKVKMNKPIYLGLSILGISKILMYEFWYDYMKPKYNDDVKLCYMDTDTFVMHIKINDFYKDISDDVDNRIDTSNYEVKRPLSDCNGTRTHNHLVRKRTLNPLAKLAKWLSVRLRTKWLWVRVPLQSLNLQIWRLLRARSSLTFRQL